MGESAGLTHACVVRVVPVEVRIIKPEVQTAGVHGLHEGCHQVFARRTIAHGGESFGAVPERYAIVMLGGEYRIAGTGGFE